MKKRIFKKVLSAVLACCMVLGGNLPYTPETLRDFALTANAAGECYLFNSTTGIFTLKGNVVLNEIKNFEQKSGVKTIKTAEGTILPERCLALFSNYSHCTSMDLSNADTSNVTDMDDMFHNCQMLTSLDLSSFDTSKVTCMDYMFSGCSELTTLNLSSFDTSKVISMSNMFSGCRKLTSLDLSGFNTSKVTDMKKMFDRCSALTSLDLSTFSAGIVESADGMFDQCTSLSEFTLGKDFGDIAEGHMLPNGKGWVKRDELSTVISGSGKYAVIQNEGTMKYIAAGDGYTLWFDANGGTGTMSAAILDPDSNKVATYRLPECSFTSPENVGFAGWEIDGNVYQPGDMATITITTTVTPAKALWAAKCGDDLVWYFDDTSKTLTIIGTGDMYDYETANLPPWSDDVKSIEHIILPDGLTHIGDNAFLGCSALQEITIPETVTSIGKSVFYLNALKTVTVPSSVTKIGHNAFSLCLYLADLRIMNPDCELPDNYSLVTNKLTSTEVDGKKTRYTGTIHGLAGSTAETYAETHNIKFEPVTLTVTFDADGTGGTMPAMEITRGGETITMPECGFTAPENCAFAGWQLGETTYQPGDQYSVKKSVTFKALWKQTHFNVSFDANGGTGTMKTVTVESGSSYTLPKCTFTAPKDMVFGGWMVGKSPNQPGNQIIVKENQTVTAAWVSPKCGDGLTWEYDAETKTLTITGTGDMYDYANDSANLHPWRHYSSSISHVILPDGLTHIGDYAFMYSNLLQEITIPETVTSIGKGAFYLGALRTVTIPSSVTKIGNRAFELNLYLTDLWILNPECELPEDYTLVTDRAMEVAVDGKKTYYTGRIHGFEDSTAEAYAKAHNIKFELITSPVSFDANGGTGTMKGVIAEAGTIIKLPECGFTAPENCVFDGWQIGETIYQPGDEYTVTENVTVKPRWKQTHFNVSFAANGGKGTMETVKIETGAMYDLPECGFTAPEGKGFSNWSIDGTVCQPGDKVTVSADLTVAAVWIDTVTVTFAANGGTGEMKAAAVTDFDYPLPECGFTAPKNRHFAGWFIGGEVKQAGERITLTGDLTLYATWDTALSIVKIDANGAEGSIKDFVVLADTAFVFPSCTLTAPAGKCFAGWQLGDKTYQPLDTLTVTADVTVKALWNDILYTISFDANGGTGDMEAKAVLPNTEYTLAKCSFTAPAGAEFLVWQVGDKTYEAGDTLTITEDTVIKALWSESEQAVLMGDVSGDGTVDQVDAILLSRYAAAWEGIELNLRAADLNADSTADIADAMILARYVAGWEGYDQYIVSSAI